MLPIGIAGITQAVHDMRRRWFVVVDALSGQSEPGALAAGTCAPWRAPGWAPPGSGAGNR